MSIKINKKQLKNLILEAIEEIRTDGRGFSPATIATSKALANMGVAKKPESVRRRLMQLVADLDLKNPTPQEIKELADMITSLMDAAQDADKMGLEEGHTKADEEKIKDVISQLRKAVKAHKNQADTLQKIIDDSPADELKEEDEPIQEANCGCGKNPCETFGRNSEKITVYIDEAIENYLEESLYYGLIDEEQADAEALLEKKKKKACKPSKGKKYAKRVGGKCKSYGAKGYRISPGTSKGDSYCARSYGDMKSHGKDCSGKDRGTPLCLSRQKWKCSGKYSRKGK
tara:strand:+ start:55 stop:915 length:861 start_codon:yes stop_codon:yes gene_type:complete